MIFGGKGPKSMVYNDLYSFDPDPEKYCWLTPWGMRLAQLQTMLGHANGSICPFKISSEVMQELQRLCVPLKCSTSRHMVNKLEITELDTPIVRFLLEIPLG